ncbi:MAG: ABC transporter ATP-binding protein [Solobacterium sp.]|jgi:ABC-type sugar transport system ATPase subunit|nr:ABC transporter ATP-binding protein [Solobacterium sp.]
MDKIILENLVKVYPFDRKKKKTDRKPAGHYTNEGMLAVRDLSLTIDAGDFFVLLGPSGCGKSTMLRMIAGLEEISSGSIYFGEQLMNSVKTSDRSIAMVSQESNLYPHLSVAENIASPLKAEMLPQAEINSRVDRMLQILGINHLRNKKPGSLSGGEKQLTAIGRALIKESDLILFDEPLSSLDEKSRNRIRVLLIKLHNEYPATFIYVTHSQEEALTLSDHMAVMNEGIIEQTGTAEQLYFEPQNEFTAEFLGMPPMNLFHSVKLIKEGTEVKAELLGCSYPLTDEQSKEILKHGLDQSYDLGIRPFDMTVDEKKETCTVEVVETIEDEHFLHMIYQEQKFIVATRSTRTFLRGAKIGIVPVLEHAVFFDSATKKADYLKPACITGLQGE